MKIVGLTGSIGMGKSTTAGLFSALGVPVYDADAAVHELYAKGGAAVAAVGEAFPGVVVDDAVDRARLSQEVLGNSDALKRLEQIVHPMIGAHRRDFFARATDQAEPLVILDVPLLFETGGDRALDAVIVVSAPESVQRERVLARADMSPQKLDAILQRQMPDAEKRERADFVVDTSQGIDTARTEVRHILTILADPAWMSKRAR